MPEIEHLDAQLQVEKIHFPPFSLCFQGAFLVLPDTFDHLVQSL